MPYLALVLEFFGWILLVVWVEWIRRTNLRPMAQLLTFVPVSSLVAIFVVISWLAAPTWPVAVSWVIAFLGTAAYIRAR